MALKLGHRCQSCPALLKLECDPWLHFSEHVGNCFSNHSNGVFIKYRPYSLPLLEQSCNLPWHASPLMKHWILSYVDSCLIIMMHLYRSNHIKPRFIVETLCPHCLTRFLCPLPHYQHVFFSHSYSLRIWFFFFFLELGFYPLMENFQEI